MIKYNTGNPVGSADPRDLYDNATIADEYINSTDATTIDRFGVSRATLAGIDADARAAIANAGYIFVSDYAAGIELTSYNQVVRDTSGEFWRVSGSTNLPYTTTGAGLPEGGAFVSVGDANLRQALVQPVATYDNVQQMVTDARLPVNSLARTLGYYSPGDGGGNEYQIVAAGTGTADGGRFIDINNGLQAKGLFSDGNARAKQFGAIGDGSTDSSSNILSWLSYCFSNEIVAILDSGQFVCASSISVAATSNITLAGFGQDASELLFTESATNGLSITVPYPAVTPSRGISVLRGFTVNRGAASGGPTGTAIYFEQEDGTGGNFPSTPIHFENISVGVAKGYPAGNSFLNGFHVKRPTTAESVGAGARSNFSNCDFLGRANDASLAGAGYRLESSVGSRMINCRAYWAEKAVEVVDDTEGPSLVNCTFVACDWGVYCDTGIQDPGLDINTCHMNNFKGGIYAVGRNQITISGSLFYQRPESIDSPYYDIYLGGSASFASIVGNIFGASSESTTPSNSTTGIYIADTFSRAVIDSNVISNRDTGVYIEATVGSTFIDNNDTTGLASHILDLRPRGENPSAFDRSFRQGSFVRAFANNPQSISNDLETTLASCFGTAGVFSEDACQFSASTGRMTVLEGTKTVRLSANISFSTNSSGLRQAVLYKNGALEEGCFFVTSGAIAGQQTRLNCVSSPIEVEAGDYFEVAVLQDSGGALDVPPGKGTWFSLEVLA